MKKQKDTTDFVVSSALLNRLRAAVLGANDGIISTSAVVMGAAGVTGDAKTIVVAGFAALVAGAFSMAVGEYVSVSSQSDAELAYIEREKKYLKNNPEKQLEELTQAYEQRGLSRKTAELAAKELTKKDALRAHLETEYGPQEDDVSSPSQAAIASFLAFSVGGAIPFLVSWLTPDAVRLYAIFGATVTALGLTGYISAKATGASPLRATLRIIVGGIVAMGVTYVIGKAFGVTLA